MNTTCKQKYAYYEACCSDIELVGIPPEDHADVLKSIDRALMYLPVTSLLMIMRDQGLFEEYLPFFLSSLIIEYDSFYEFSCEYILAEEEQNAVSEKCQALIKVEVKELDDDTDKYPGIIDMTFCNLKLDLTDEPSSLYFQKSNEPNYKVIQHLVLLYLSIGEPSYTFHEDVLREYFSIRDQNYAMFLIKLFLKEIFIVYNSNGYTSDTFFFMPIIDIWFSHEYRTVINALMYRTKTGTLNRVCSICILMHLFDQKIVEHVLRYFDRVLFDKALFEEQLDEKTLDEKTLDEKTLDEKTLRVSLPTEILLACESRSSVLLEDISFDD